MHGRKLLEQLGLEGGGPCTSSSLKPLESEKEVNCRREPAVEKSCYRFPENPKKYNPL